jgi:pimeloyl-ACP methyl ester carboxylesterase
MPPPAPATDAPVWVLLRGLSRGQDHWGDFPARLQATWPHAQVITPDLPGNGRRHGERSPARLAAMTDDVRAQVQRQVGAQAGAALDRPVHLLALSLGAMVACDWAHRHPAEVARLVLINTSLRRHSPWHHRLQPAALGRLLRCLATRADATTWERTILALTTHRPRQPAQTLAAWVALRRQQPVQPANLLRQLWAAARHASPARPPPVPTLLLASSADRLVNVRCSQALAQAWHCPLRPHPWAGHDLPLDDPDWVLQQLSAWLAAPGGGPASVKP